MTSEYALPPYIEEMFKFDVTDSDIEALKETLRDMKTQVKLKLFTTGNNRQCFSCLETEKLLNVLIEASPPIGSEKAIIIEKYDLETSTEMFKKYDVSRVPTILLLDGAITYYGMPAGEEIKALVETIIRISTSDHGLSTTTINELSKLKGKAIIETIVTPPCPYCPYAVLLANMFAYASKLYGFNNVKSVVVEAYENPDIADKYAVTTVPTIAINGRVVFVGLPYETQLLKAVKRLAQLEL
ncbi:MAG: thioredoxin family protein [Ignisphaera sp.]